MNTKVKGRNQYIQRWRWNLITIIYKINDKNYAKWFIELIKKNISKN